MVLVGSKYISLEKKGDMKESTISFEDYLQVHHSQYLLHI